MQRTPPTPSTPTIPPSSSIEIPLVLTARWMDRLSQPVNISQIQLSVLPRGWYKFREPGGNSMLLVWAQLDPELSAQNDWCHFGCVHSPSCNLGDIISIVERGAWRSLGHLRWLGTCHRAHKGRRAGLLWARWESAAFPLKKFVFSLMAPGSSIRGILATK